jgi:hypothetical protein
MDLTRAFPRSPYDMLAGVVMLGRTTDKARAFLSGGLGDYEYNCPLDRELFAFLGIDSAQFAELVRKGEMDEEVARSIDAAYSRSLLEKDAFNDKMRHLKPGDGEGQKWLEERRGELEREDLHTFFEVLDADEGRF